MAEVVLSSGATSTIWLFSLDAGRAKWGFILALSIQSWLLSLTSLELLVHVGGFLVVKEAVYLW